ncbi:hypothetical protein [Sporolactobacillus pectinivorans]|uniref:hypothetical protein n=1 Tax=Sporolactobacillus pectinivorans TaxID=1591408 RepID=UPI000C25B123|nr:hypothetical protein [Sporolactobacillus pectinivorans]
MKKVILLVWSKKVDQIRLQSWPSQWYINELGILINKKQDRINEDSSFINENEESISKTRLPA